MPLDYEFYPGSRLRFLTRTVSTRIINGAAFCGTNKWLEHEVLLTHQFFSFDVNNAFDSLRRRLQNEDVDLLVKTFEPKWADVRDCMWPSAPLPFFIMLPYNGFYLARASTYGLSMHIHRYPWLWRSA